MTVQTYQDALEFADPKPFTQDAPKPARMPTPHACGGCDARWGGFNTAHCGTCHKTFGGVSGFDAHRSDGTCLDPATIGMRLTSGRPYECWSFEFSGDRD